MKISKWVDMGQEVEIEIGVDDIRASLSECFERATGDELDGDGPNRHQIIYTIDALAKFLRAMTDRHIDCLTHEQRKVIETFLAEQSKRYAPRGVMQP
jgi:hypothetical protein